MLNKKLTRVGYAYLLPTFLLFFGFIGNLAIAFVNTEAAMAQSKEEDLPNVGSQLKPRKGDANVLRSPEGDPVTPTNSDLFDRQTVDRNTNVNLQRTDITFAPIVPVTPAIPNASPQSIYLNVPGAFTTDPLHAIPLFQGSGDTINPTSKDPQKNPQKGL
jgi:hypothetical protein